MADAYLLYITYKNGDTSTAYACYKNPWYYFNDMLNYRIQLSGNSVTKQQYRRKHDAKSWYPIDLISAVRAQKLDDEYIQNELDPIRKDVSKAQQDIIENKTYIEQVDQTVINNYNEFITYQNAMWGTVGATSQSGYDQAFRNVVSDAGYGAAIVAYNTTLSLNNLVNNYNQLITALKAAFNSCVSVDNAAIGVRLKEVQLTTFNIGVLNEDGSIDQYEFPSFRVNEGDTDLLRLTNTTYNSILSRLSALEDRVSRLEG